MSNGGWICPFCETSATLRDEDSNLFSEYLFVPNKYGKLEINGRMTICPNPDCKELTFKLFLFKISSGSSGSMRKGIHRSWQLVPESQAKTFPAYIPSPILEDYREACLIRDHSPKASATLSRRCLQGIIRDFWKVKKNKLSQEIEAIKGQVDPLTWQAIDAVRKVGNISAHMEKDINLIIEVEPKEAGLLIGLIETVLRDWYITQHERKKRLEAVVELGRNKKDAKQSVEGEATPEG